MFRFGYDALAENAPDWYADVDANLLKENYNEASRIAKDAAKRCKESGDNDGEAMAMCSYVKALLIEGDAWNARKFASEALESAQGKAMKAALTHLLARIALKDRKNSEASKHAQAAFEMYKELNSEKGELSVLMTNTLISIGSSNLLEAEESAASCKQKAEALGDLRAKAAALYLDYELAVKDDVAPSAVDALDLIIETISDPQSLGIAYLMSAEIQRAEGVLQDALDRATQACLKFDEAVDGNKKAHAVLCISKTLHEHMNFDDSLTTATAALDLYKATRNKEGQAEALRIQADVAMRKAKDLKDIVYKMEEVSFLYRQLKNKKKEADALNELTKIQVRFLGPSELAEPLRRSRRAAQLYDEDYAGDSLGNAEANLTVAKIYLALNDDVEEGLPFAQRSHEVFKTLEKTTGEAEALTTMARIQYAMGNKDEGARLADKALEAAQDSGDKDLQTTALDIVENKGKPGKPAPMIEQSDIIIFVDATRLAFFDEFEGRRARYKAVDGNKGEAKEAKAIADSALDPQAITTAKSKVEYTIRWQLVPNLDLSKMPIPK